MLVSVWFLLTKVLFRTGDLQLGGGAVSVIKDELATMGPMKLQEKLVLAVAGFMVFGWVSRGFISTDMFPFIANVRDAQISILGALLLFTIPAGFKKDNKDNRLLDWQTALKIPWGIILLFGGGLAIAAAFRSTGLAEWIGSGLSDNIDGMSLFMAILIVTAVVCFLTEVTSNTAIAALFIPIMAAFAIAMEIHPFAVIMAVCFASSMCFAMPAATPPNAIAIGSGYVKVRDLAYAGWILNFVTIAMVVMAIMMWLPLAWNVDISVFPSLNLIN